MRLISCNTFQSTCSDLWEINHGDVTKGIDNDRFLFQKHVSRCFYLEYVDENVLLGLLGAADVLQDDGVVHALGVRLVQVVSVRLVPLLEGQEDLVLVCAHDLNVLEEEEEGLKMRTTSMMRTLEE